ncbi:hypothetical protein OS493_031121 [Desmophyllum pertusum]|uniref:Uncharacterized protein n=1 Tax=Desmophyllum pertusum TaxID=174260 RepID=A0A9W9Y8I3_9CNID|nr:hypothetical protein OS493_031121 [Desmophyllum pertusum]
MASQLASIVSKVNFYLCHIDKTWLSYPSTFKCGIVGISHKDVNRHECGKGECPSCAENVVNLKQHRCHLQPIRQRKKNHRRDDSDTVEEHPVCIYLIYYDIEKPDKTRAIL